MALSKNLMAAGLAVLAVVATAAAASAAPAYATGNVNVRTGPSTQYRVVDTLRRGEQVDVQQCRGSWCYVEKRGRDGWVSANYLSRGGHGGSHGGWYDRDSRDRTPHYNPRPERPRQWNPRPPRHAPVYPTHPRRPGSSVCVNGPNGYFCIGN